MQKGKGDLAGAPIFDSLPSATWQDEDGFHALIPGEEPSEEKLAEMTRRYQKKLKRSPMYKMWVMEFGKKKAKELLKECRIETRP